MEARLQHPAVDRQTVIREQIVSFLRQLQSGVVEEVAGDPEAPEATVVREVVVAVDPALIFQEELELRGREITAVQVMVEVDRLAVVAVPGA